MTYSVGWSKCKSVYSRALSFVSGNGLQDGAVQSRWDSFVIIVAVFINIFTKLSKTCVI